MSSERGSVTIWMLMLSMMLLLFGGLAIDYWRALALQSELHSVADSAALAGASGIDEEIYRSTGELVLDGPRARSLATAAVAWQDVDVTDMSVDVNRDEVTVTLTASLDLGLLGVFVDQSEALNVRGTAVAAPVLVP